MKIVDIEVKILLWISTFYEDKILTYPLTAFPLFSIDFIRFQELRAIYWLRINQEPDEGE